MFFLRVNLFPSFPSIVPSGTMDSNTKWQRHAGIERDQRQTTQSGIDASEEVAASRRVVDSANDEREHGVEGDCAHACKVLFLCRF